MKIRKISLRIIAVAFLLIAIVASASKRRKPASVIKEQRPNIIIIMADDLDSKQLSCYGGQNINTRNIDALAAEGLKFNQIIASEPVCVPTRASLFTGLYPVKHGAYQNHKPVYNNIKSVAHYLGNLGYRVGLSGKDHVTKPKAIFPFQIIPGFEPNCIASTDEYFLDSVKEFVDQKDNPFCLFLMSINPHAPWTVGDPLEFDPSKLKLPAHWADTKFTREEFCKYLAEVRRLDNQVGDVINLLKEKGQDKNTIVIFLGEQGPQFPGGKWSLYDNGVKSSMIVKWPGVTRPGTENSAIVQYEDITPTLVDIAGGKPIAGLDGKSFLSVIKGKALEHRQSAYLIYNNIPEGPSYPIRAIRDKKFKLINNLTAEKPYYIKYMMNTANKQLVWTSWVEKSKTEVLAKKLTSRIANRPAVEFYDLIKDPEELNNLAEEAEYKTLITNYQHKLDEWMRQQGDKGAMLDVEFGGD
ncbi:sulfatase family protein [Desertivirga arenae]|uniref:sulfatase family protein n=1 Tax=Desertivirga arenae TaxID=2810309 RepID=UPI001A96B812|nr:sulfatase [Pedobacter sp. SYSU D00823]